MSKLVEKKSRGFRWWEVFKYFCIAYLVVCTFFYMFYLYGKYANDRQAVASFYDDEKDQLRSPYHAIMLALLAILFIFLFALSVTSGPGGQGVFIILFAMVWGVGWVIDHFAAVIAGKTSRYKEFPRV